MVPPWVPSAPPPDAESTESGDQVDDPGLPGIPDVAIPRAPEGRFYATRVNLGKFASSGNADNLRRGVGNYVKGGYGGSGTAAKRFAGTAQTAGSLYDALSSGAAAKRSPERDALEAAFRSGASVAILITALIETLLPVDGSQDTELGRTSLAEASSDLLVRFPDADILNLTDEQRNMFVARYVAMDVYGRFFLDVGKHIIENAPSYTAGLSRLHEAKEYIRETVIAALGKMLAATQSLTKSRVITLVSTALRDAFDVFQGYTE
jgi:hypothetical protein